VKETEISVFQQIKEGLEDGIRFTRGQLTLRTAVVPTPPPEVSAGDIVRLREDLNISQGVLAQILNVSPKTIQSWEQGERTPSQAALRLIQVFKANPTVVCQIVGITTARGRGKQVHRLTNKRQVKPRRAGRASSSHAT
jgi:putative transcriptional regulator